LKNKIMILILLFLLCFAVSACGNEPSTGPQKPNDIQTITVTDSFGRKVSVPEKVERIAALYSFAGYTVCLLGKGPNLVAVPGGLQRDVLLREMIPQISEAAVPRTGGTINIEELLRIRPDLVIIRGDTAADQKELEKLDKSGLPYIIVEYGTVQEQQDAITIIGKAIGKGKEAEAYNKYYKDLLEQVERVVQEILPEQRTRVYYSENQVTRTTHRDTLSADWSRFAGIINVSITEELALINNDYYASLEQILFWDPEVIIANETTAVNYIRGNPQWSGIQAVQNKRVHQLPQGISRWGHPGSVEIPLAVLWTAKTVYPELFEGVNLKDEIAYYYDTFFRYKLSEKQIEQILSGEGLRESK
jgi:iron complex transport system substrate-binding protein